ncbi:MAG: NAD(P)/FAD-dependent oxidoreductase [Gammaproteobacteria bacterium]|nr:NAD(P)/FAD-dependent oxidoreductase [Gammaproteobacteria bacterium]MBU1488312.1 NAD(P)/FAD-dependent oxidoreductase [Gammaproteobacteria bacterium]MBU2067544.1 NAD(P)/FAD-dependent oxidoreductase [Gammaproteobacteria bacterium]MBU2138474.1 NAD(P)/FAD-dependent oxidoreductase [Gammaproteobacteria bacterium]MBU2216369.1 NAD(P)/FAD-dependent oxidoreductase [Gammaproteobacteria bacterium]
MSEQADVLIIGAGPAGLSAALAAANDGEQVVLLDDNPLPGGQIWRDGAQANIPQQARHLRDSVEAHTHIQRHAATRVVAKAGSQALLVENPERGWVITYRSLILCTGARELLLPFPGWTLPGVTGAGGLQALIKGGMPVVDERIVIAGSGPLLLASADTAKHHGAQVVRIAEQASLGAVATFAMQLPRWPHKLLQSFSLFDAGYRTGTRIVAALGQDRLEGVRLQRGNKVEELACERLACGFGLIPNAQLGQALGCALGNNAIQVDAWQATDVAGVYAAGECTGFGGSELALVEGRIAGHVAAGNREAAQRLRGERQRWQRFANSLNQHFALDPALKRLAAPDTLLCRCEDVPYAAVAAHANWREAKLSTRCGMGACQGKVCGAAAHYLFDWPPVAPRPPFTPTRIETLIQLESAPQSDPR